MSGGHIEKPPKIPSPHIHLTISYNAMYIVTYIYRHIVPYVTTSYIPSLVTVQQYTMSYTPQ